jgi:anti-sigma B factor antagonist
MRIIERPIQATTILDVHGKLAGPDATELLEATVRRVTRTGAERLVVNLGDVPSIDAAGLGALVAAYGVVRRSGGTLRLARPAKRLYELLVVCRLLTVFETFDSVEDALSADSEASPDPSTTGAAASPPSQTSLNVIQRFLRGASTRRGASMPALHRARLLFNQAVARLTGAGKESLNDDNFGNVPANAGGSREES